MGSRKGPSVPSEVSESRPRAYHERMESTPDLLAFRMAMATYVLAAAAALSGIGDAAAVIVLLTGLSAVLVAQVLRGVRQSG